MTVTGWAGTDQIARSTITTVNTNEGINDSLANADWAYGVLSGAEAFETVSAWTMYTEDLSVSENLYFGGAALYLTSIRDYYGDVVRVVAWEW